MPQLPYIPVPVSYATVTARKWMSDSSNVHQCFVADPATTRAFFDNPNSFVSGGNPAVNPVQDGLKATPLLNYTSEAQFAADIAGSVINTGIFQWVRYDPEGGATWPTPAGEKADPQTAMANFITLAHAHSFSVIVTPARDLANTDTAHPRLAGETDDQWFLRTNIAAAAAPADIFSVQDQANQPNPAEFTHFFNTARSQAKKANLGVQVWCGISVTYGNGQVMYTSAASVGLAEGFWINIIGNTTDSLDFMRRVLASGDGIMVQSELLRADISGAVQLLLRPPVYAGHTFSAQSIPANVITGINMDAEDTDPYNGHVVSAAAYFPPLPGWYLAESSCALAATATGGSVQAGIQYVTNGAAQVNPGGGRMPIVFTNQTFSSQHPVCARLVQAVQTGPGRTGTDTINASVRQTTGGALNTAGLAAGSFQEACTLQVRFVGTGDPSALKPPAFQPAPQPPALLTARWLQRNVHDAIAFLINPPIMESQLNGTQSLASQAGPILPTVGTTVLLDSQIVDNYNAYGTLITGTWLAPVDGVYYLYGQVDGTTVATSQNLAAGLTITSNRYHGGATTTWWGGSIVTSAFADDNCATVVRVMRLNAGDNVSLAAYQRDSGSNAMTLDGTHSSKCRMIAVWRGF